MPSLLTVPAATLISYFQAVILGLTQGIAEPFPISSLGHAVVLPALFGWNIHQNDKFFLTFLIATHFATAVVFLVFFIKDWVLIVKGIFRSLRMREIRDGRHLRAARLAAGRGHDPGRDHRAAAPGPDPQTVRLAVGCGGLPDRQRRRAAVLRAPAPPPAAAGRLPRGLRRAARETLWRQTISVGTSQAFALIPGISRSGMTMGGGLLSGLSNEDAARFGFLLATPVIFAAAALKLPELLGHEGSDVRGPALVGGLCAAATTVFAVKFLLRFFQTNSLTPFGYYCMAFGAFCLIVFALRRRARTPAAQALGAACSELGPEANQAKAKQANATTSAAMPCLVWWWLASASPAETCPGKNEGSECAGSTK